MSEDSVELCALASVDPLDSDAIELLDEADASVVLPATSDDASSDARDAATTVVASPSSPEPSDTSDIGLLPSPEPSTVASVVEPSSGSVAPMFLHSSAESNRLLLPSQPPYQNRPQPPYSTSKKCLTVAHAFCGDSGTAVQPSNLLPCASLTPSGQQPYLLSAQVQPSPSGPLAGVLPSPQHLNSLCVQWQPWLCGPFAAVTPSGQQPNWCAWHGHPSNDGPVASVSLSGQQPCRASGSCRSAQNDASYTVPDLDAQCTVRVSTVAPHSSHWNVHEAPDTRSQYTSRVCLPSVPHGFEQLLHGPSNQRGGQDCWPHFCVVGGFSPRLHSPSSTSFSELLLLHVTLRVCTPPPHVTVHGSNAVYIHE
uniref:Uncharacterized protein n=1 Tax=Anopheles coluzzii TaxID=1518534 RepID=A0A8W7PND2_ANOCL